MRLSQNPPTLLSLLFTVLSHTSTVEASPLLDLDFSFLHQRQNNGNCGADNQYTCFAGQACTTTNNIASCVAAGPGGYAVYTTTFTETNLLLRTSTYTSSWQAQATAPVVTATPAVWVNPANAIASCLPEPAQHSCGAICCASNQECKEWGWCTEVAPLASATTLWTYTNQPAPTVTNSISSGVLPVRPTSGGASTMTTTRSATTTMPFLAPATASGSTLPIMSSSGGGGGLSAGAIAGIVIGVLAGIIILLLICFCCILKGALSTILGIFGLGSKKRKRSERTTEVTETYSRHGSAAAASRRDTHTNWFGRPTKVSEKRKDKKSSGFGGLGAVGAGLAGLALVLGLKRNHDKKKTSRPSHSDIGSSYYTDSYTGTSASK